MAFNLAANVSFDGSGELIKFKSGETGGLELDSKGKRGPVKLKRKCFIIDADRRIG